MNDRCIMGITISWIHLPSTCRGYYQHFFCRSSDFTHQIEIIGYATAADNHLIAVYFPVCRRLHNIHFINIHFQLLSNNHGYGFKSSLPHFRAVVVNSNSARRVYKNIWIHSCAETFVRRKVYYLRRFTI